MKRLGLVAVVAVALALPGCRHTTAGPLIRYVALGDSYSSGEGNRPFDAGTDTPDDICHRSRVAYPRVLHVHNRIELVHRACSGARVDDLLNARFPTEPAQLTWLDQLTDVVTVTIGGNDAFFGPVTKACIVAGSRCTAAQPVVEAAVAVLAQRLPPVLADIRQRAPHARILMLGYPQIFPDPALVKIDGCGMLNFGGIGITGAAVASFRQDLERLDETVRTAAATAGVEYVDVVTAFAGHEVCTRTPWVYGLLPLDLNTSLHPSAAGHRALAARVAAVLTHPRA